MRFRFGVSLWQARGRAEWVATARKAEALGYDMITVPDHLTDRLAPMPAMISAAEATTRLRVGTNVLNNDLRHPVLVAREAATVDLPTEGRLQLGLGAGSLRAEYDEIGLAFERQAKRVRGGSPKRSRSSNLSLARRDGEFYRRVLSRDGARAPIPAGAEPHPRS